MTKVTLYGKPDCCLCEEAKETIEQVRSEIRFDLEQVDISRDPQLEARYGERIPLVWVDGRLAFKFRVDPAELRARLRSAQPVEAA